MDNLKTFFSGHKIVFAILGAILLIEIIYAVRFLTSPVTTPPPAGKAGTQSSVGKISLTSPKTNYKVMESIPVSVMIDTAGHIVDGVDLIVRFDPKILEATATGLIKGKILDEYPLVSLDAKQGLISISGISSLKTGFAGTGQFAALNLKARVPGVTSLTIDFKEGSTTDSNLVETSTSQDILQQIDNLELNIQ